jgi:aspartate aminotransferase
LVFLKEQISVGAGGKQVIFNAILASINPGDEVLIPAPYWVSYPDIVLLAGGTPKVVICDEADEFKINAKKLRENLSKKNKMADFKFSIKPNGILL